MNKKRKLLTMFVLAILTLLIVGIIAIGAFSVCYVLKPWNSDVNYLKGEAVEIVSFDGIKLVGNKRYSEKSTDNWVLLVHCYRGSKSTMSVYEEHYHEAGYNTICVDNRAHGQSKGNFIGMGYLDKFDISCWVDYILEENPKAKIVLHGLSMGAASCMIYSGSELVSENVVAVVEDSGYLSADSYLTWKLKSEFGLPKFPIIPIADISARIIAGYYLSDASAIEGIKNCDIPTLFIHGTDDTTVPIEDCYRLYGAAECEKEIYVIESSGHGGGVYDDTEEYWNKVDSFLKKVGV